MDAGCWGGGAEAGVELIGERGMRFFGRLGLVDTFLAEGGIDFRLCLIIVPTGFGTLGQNSAFSKAWVNRPIIRPARKID